MTAVLSCKRRLKWAHCHGILKRSSSVNSFIQCDCAKLCGNVDKRILVGICMSGECAEKCLVVLLFSAVCAVLTPPQACICKYEKDRGYRQMILSICDSPGFLRRPEHQLSSLQFDMVFLTSVQKAPVYYHQLQRHSFLPYHLRFIIPQSSYYSVACNLRCKKNLKRTGTIIYFCRTQQFFSAIIKSHITNTAVFFVCVCQSMANVR